MAYLDKTIGIFALIFVMAVTSLHPAMATPGGWYQHDDAHQQLLGLVTGTQNDLTLAKRDAQGTTQQARIQQLRIRTASQRLGSLHAKLSQGQFDQELLKAAVSALNDVLSKNALSPANRDLLRADVSHLTDAAGAFGH